mmetsp:Transcript_3817/g.6409  ORF Transcript_3817/g.6409 Transcript_3817/m.6409 type:complete len:415 (-) Transcript_3817:325-1569(-)
MAAAQLVAMDFPHVSNMKQDKGGLWKTSTTRKCDAAAWSGHTISGWQESQFAGVSFVIGETTATQAYFVGLVHTAAAWQDDPSISAKDDEYRGFDFAVDMDARAGKRCVCQSWEGGRLKAGMGEVVPGDTIAIVLNKSEHVIEFRINGEVKATSEPGSTVTFPLRVKVCAVYPGPVPMENLQWTAQPTQVDRRRFRRNAAPEPIPEQLRSENSALKASLQAAELEKVQLTCEIDHLKNKCDIETTRNGRLEGILQKALAQEKGAMEQLRQQCETERQAKEEAEMALARAQLEIQELEAKYETERLSKERLAAETARLREASQAVKLEGESKHPGVPVLAQPTKRSHLLWSFLTGVFLTVFVVVFSVLFQQLFMTPSEQPSFSLSAVNSEGLNGSLPNSGVYPQCGRCAVGDAGS